MTEAKRPLRIRRLEAGLTQAQLAEQAGVSSASIRNAEAGKKLHPETIAKIDAALQRLERG